MLKIVAILIVYAAYTNAAPQYYPNFSPSQSPCSCANPNLAAPTPVNPVQNAQGQPRFVSLEDLFDVSIEHHHHHHRPHYNHRPYGGYSGEYYGDHYPYRGGYGGYGGYGYRGGYRREGENAKESHQAAYNPAVSGQYNYQSGYQQGYQVTDPTVYKNSAPYGK